MALDFTGDIKDGGAFRLTTKASSQANAVFIAQDGERIVVTRRAIDLLHLPDSTPVLANWHGQYRTDAFRLTIGGLRKLAEAYTP